MFSNFYDLRVFNPFSAFPFSYYLQQEPIFIPKYFVVLLMLSYIDNKQSYPFLFVV